MARRHRTWIWRAHVDLPFFGTAFAFGFACKRLRGSSVMIFDFFGLGCGMTVPFQTNVPLPNNTPFSS